MSGANYMEESKPAEKWEANPIKHSRKRKKGLYALIRNQKRCYQFPKKGHYIQFREMEFYFSNSNLAKDKFLAPLIAKSYEGYIDLTVFLNFNKIRALSTDIEDVKKALMSSEILKLSEDSNCVRRITPAQPVENVDECTLYLENLSPHATHDWIREIFNPFGKINYVSLPRLRTSKKIKGFAFVEFDNKESVESACKYFSASSGAKTSPLPKDDGCKKISADTDAGSSGKRRLEETQADHCNEGAKKKRLETEDDPHSKLVEGGSAEMAKEKKVKHRKHKKKHKDRNEVDTLQLLVMSKLEWKRLKKKYLALQKANMTEVKKFLGFLRKNDHPSKVENSAVDLSKPVPNSNAPEFKSGVIIKIIADKPFTNAKKIQAEMKTLPGVAYIELEDDTSEAYIRCKDTKNTVQVIKAVEQHGQTTILQEKEEKEYWRRILVEREAKFAAKNKPKQRGCNKVIQKAVKSMEISNKHIRFDE